MGKKVSEDTKAEEAANLAKLFNAAGNPSYEKFAKDFGIAGGKAVISQHINKVRPISLEAAIGYAIGFGKPLSAISPRLSAIIERIPQPRKYQTAPAINGMMAAEQAPVQYYSLTTELQKHVSNMNERGMILLIDKAEEIAARHPKEKKEAA